MTESQFIKAVAKAISEAQNCGQAALNTYEICRKAAEDWGMKPDIEVAIRHPGEPRHHPDIDCWCVAFEAGPYEWAVAASLSTDTKGKVLAEPYYSFDLCFSEV
jgi:hypothetical protein